MNNYGNDTQVQTFSKVIRKYIDEETRRNVLQRLHNSAKANSDCLFYTGSVKYIGLENTSRKSGAGRFSGSDSKYEITFDEANNAYTINKTGVCNGTTRIVTESISEDDAMKILRGNFRMAQVRNNGMLRELAINLNTERPVPSTIAACDRCIFEWKKSNLRIILDGRIRCESYSEKALHDDGSSYGIDFGTSAIMTVCCDTPLSPELSRAIDIMKTVV